MSLAVAEDLPLKLMSLSCGCRELSAADADELAAQVAEESAADAEELAVLSLELSTADADELAAVAGAVNC